MVFEMGKDLEILHAQKGALEGKEYEGAIKMPINRELIKGRSDYIEERVAPSDSGFFEQKGDVVVGAIRRFIGPQIADAVSQAGLRIEDIAWVFPHQPSKIGLDVLSRSARDFNFFRDIEEGNWSSGSIPKALFRAIQERSINGRTNIVFGGFGAAEKIGTATAVLELAA
jgi:3-oxoacyl-[acyl-carrier-protein] synthase III